MIVRELVTRLGFDAEDKKVGRFNAAVSRLKVGLIATAAAATAMSAAAFRLTNDTARYGDELSKTARRLGINVDALEQLRFAADRSGVAQNTLEMALQRMTRRLSEAAAGGGEAQKAIQELGLDAQALGAMAPEDALNTLSDALAGVENQSDRVRLAFKFFDSEGVALLNMLGEGSAEVNALRQEFERLSGGLTKEDAQAAELFQDKLTNLMTTLQGLRLQIGAKLMPVIRPMIEAFSEFLVENRKIITARIAQAFEAIVNVMRNLREVAGRVVGALKPLVDIFRNLPTSGKIAAAMAAFALAFRRFPAITVLVAIIAFLDDLGAWMKGDASLIGSLIGPYTNFADAVSKLVEALGGLEVVVGGLVALAFAPWLFRVARGLKALAGGLALLGAGTAAASGVATLSRFAKIGALAAIPFLGGGANADSDPDIEINPKTGVPKGFIADRLLTDDGRSFMQKLFDMDPDVQRRDGFTPNLAPSPDQFIDPSSSQGPEIKMNFEQNITVPAGSTSEQLAFIRRETERTMQREVNRAAKALEA